MAAQRMIVQRYSPYQIAPNPRVNALQGRTRDSRILEADGMGLWLDREGLDLRRTNRLRDTVGEGLVDSSEHGH